MKFTSLDLVMERYVGRRPELIRAEKELGDLQKLIIEGTSSFMQGISSDKEVYMKEINNHQSNKKLQAELRKLFGLKSLEIYWVKTAVSNALTVPKAYQYIDKSYSVTKDGVDVNPKLQVFVNVNTGLFTHAKMTPGEVLAIILHEIGHNFYQSEFQLLTRVNPFMPFTSMAIAAITDIPLFRRGVAKATAFSNIIMDKLRLTKIQTFFEEVAGVMYAFSLPTINKLALAMKDIKYVAKDFANPMNSIFNYAVESHADSFATDYGYGPQLATGLNKLRNSVTNVAADVPVWNFIKDFDELLFLITFQTFSGYPTEHRRHRQIIARLEKALNDPALPKELRGAAESQLEEAKQFYENYMSIENDENQKRILTWSYRKMLDTFFKGGVDIRQVLLHMDAPYKEDWTTFEKKYKH